MIASRPAARAGRRTLTTIAAAGFAVIGVVLITVASCTAQAGPPQPAAAAAGDLVPSASVVDSPTSATPLPATSTATTDALPAPSEPTTPESTAPAAPTTSAQPAPAPPTRGPILGAARPVSVSIPAIGVTSTLLDLGLNADGTVEVPPLSEPVSKAGWYNQSPTPGTLGPAIILGHIDSKKYGPGVFYNLGTLQPGDLVDVTREDGTVAVFQIDGVRSYAKADFPTLQVYGNLDHAGLRLITCGGVFDTAEGSYESNIIAFASLVSSRQA